MRVRSVAITIEPWLYSSGHLVFRISVNHGVERTSIEKVVETNDAVSILHLLLKSACAELEHQLSLESESSVGIYSMEPKKV